MKMRKKVMVKPSMPIYQLRTPIVTPVMNCDLSIGDIAVCIYGRAQVDEILEDGTLVRLNLQNYDKDNTHLAKTAKIKGVENLPEVEVNKGEELVPDEIKPEVVIDEVAPKEEIVEEVEVAVEEPTQEETKNNKRKDKRK